MRIGLVKSRQRGAFAEHDALRQRVGRQPVGAVETRAGRLADDVEPWHSGSALKVADDAAHHVVRGWRDWHELLRGIEPGSAQRFDNVREAGRIDAAHIERDRRDSLGLHQVPDRAGDLITRGQFLNEPLSARAVQRRALAADRLGDEEAFAPLDPCDGRRVELDELHVGELRTGMESELHAEPE